MAILDFTQVLPVFVLPKEFLGGSIVNFRDYSSVQDAVDISRKQVVIKKQA